MITRRELMAAPALLQTRRYRAAIIGHTGRGNYGHDWDICFNTLPNAEVAAVADPVDAGRAKAMARSKAKRGYADYREMLAKEKPDVVAIGPRHADQRIEMITAAAAAKAHIIMEKPFAATLADAERLVAVVEAAGIKLQLGHPARPMPIVTEMSKRIAAGEIGEILELRSRGKEDKRAGGEDMIVLGTHCFDLMRAFGGNPLWVSANIAGPEKKPSEPIGRVKGDDISATFGFEKGFAGHFASRRSSVVTGGRFGVTVYGSKGAVYFPLTAVPNEEAFITHRADWTGEWTKVIASQRLPSRESVNALMARDLLDAIETGRKPVCDHRDGRWTIAMVDAVYRAAESGRREPL